MEKQEEDFRFKKVESYWSEELLLGQEDCFKVKDVARLLDDTTGTYNLIQREAARLEETGVDPIGEMGFFRLGGSMWVKMSRFAPWFRKFGKKPISTIPRQMDLPTFLQQKSGLYKLKDFGDLLGDHHPLNTGFIRRQSLKLGPRASARKMGLVKDRFHGLVVVMPTFGEWFRKQLPTF